MRDILSLCDISFMVLRKCFVSHASIFWLILYVCMYVWNVFQFSRHDWPHRCVDKCPCCKEHLAFVILTGLSIAIYEWVTGGVQKWSLYCHAGTIACPNEHKKLPSSDHSLPCVYKAKLQVCRDYPHPCINEQELSWTDFRSKIEEQTTILCTSTSKPKPVFLCSITALTHAYCPLQSAWCLRRKWFHSLHSSHSITEKDEHTHTHTRERDTHRLTPAVLCSSWYFLKNVPAVFLAGSVSCLSVYDCLLTGWDDPPLKSPLQWESCKLPYKFLFMVNGCYRC